MDFLARESDEMYSKDVTVPIIDWYLSPLSPLKYYFLWSLSQREVIHHFIHDSVMYGPATRKNEGLKCLTTQAMRYDITPVKTALTFRRYLIKS